MDDKGLASLQVLDPVTRQHVEKAAEALQDEFAEIFARETIARYIAESTDLLSGASINVFVPVLAHRFARERLEPWDKPRESSSRTCPRCCSCACTTRVVVRWRPVWSSFARRDASMFARQAATPANG